MKKILYTAAVCLVTFAGQAQNPSGPNSYFSQALDGTWANGSFDEWVDITDKDGNVTGSRPKYWQSNPPYSGSIVAFEKATDRNGEAGKAAKMTTTHAQTWYTWHVHVRQADKVFSDNWPFMIANGDEFYYTFWAKGEKGGEKLYIGCSELYDPANKDKLGNPSINWDQMPYAELTTNWKQYGFQVRAKIDLTAFSIQPRLKGTYYIDDLVIEYGDELPELDPGTGKINEIGENTVRFIATEDDNIRVIAEQSGWLTLSDTMGRIISKTEISAGESTINTNGKGLYLINFISESTKINKKISIR